MTEYSLKIDKLVKKFGRRLIFSGIDIELNKPGVIGIAGENGSGKSTLVKIIAGLISPTSGKIIHSVNGQKITPEKLHKYLGFVSPYLVLYDEFSAEENLQLLSNIRGEVYNREYAESLLDRFKLLNRRKELLKGYSSGMKQRIKFISSLLHKPKILILDEPTSNLDNAGKETVYNVIEKEKEDALILVASNEENDLALCGEVIKLEEFKQKGGAK